MNSRTVEVKAETYDVVYHEHSYHIRTDVPLGVHVSLVCAVGVADEDVQPTATLEGDIGIESIDYLDVVFRLEKLYGIEIPRTAWFPDDIFFDDRYRQPLPIGSVEAPRLNPAGVALLKQRVSWLDSGQMEEFERDPVVSKYNDLITVGSISRYLQTFPEQFWAVENKAGSRFTAAVG